MSRIGKQPVQIPEGVTATVEKRTLRVKGPKGELALTLHDRVTATLDGNSLRVSVQDPDEKRDRALWGLFQVLIANMIEGVTKGFQKQLEVRGVGYRVAVAGKKLELNLGLSHPVHFEIPEGITMAVEKNTLTILGIDKQQVGEIAAKIHRMRPPEPYKGKGVRYVGEYVRQKAGKVVKAAGAK